MAFKHKATGKAPSSSSKAGQGKPAAEDDGKSMSILQDFVRDKLKNEDDNEEKVSPYQHLEKATVLQECRVFHEAQTVTQNPRKCCLLITKLLFLLVKGDSFSSAEITQVRSILVFLL